MVLILNRFEEIPPFASHLALIADGELRHKVAASDTAAVAQLSQLLHMQTTDIEVPAPDPEPHSGNQNITRPLPLLPLLHAQHRLDPPRRHSRILPKTSPVSENYQ